MVCVCVFPGCGKQMKSYTPETFHRLPSWYNDRSLVDKWLIVLNMDIETPIEMLMQRDHRVCSAHFDKDDFIIPKRAADPKNPKKVSLKKNAIPRVQQVATDKLEVRLFICCLFVVLYDFSQLVWRRKSHPNV